jgi:hypothetical protein
MPGPTPPAVETVTPPTTPTEVAPGVTIGSDATPTPTPVTSEPTAAAPQTGAYVMLRPDQLQVDPKRFQFKESDEQGVTGVLRGTTKWESDLASPIMAWQDNSGQYWVADGHQRHDLATRATAAGQPNVEMPARVYREADGYTPEHMRVLAAYKNIAEGSGTAIDAAKVLRAKVALPGDRALPSLPPRSQMVQQGNALAKLGDEAFGIVVNGIVPPGYAAHVGDLIADPAQQVAALSVLARAEPNNSEQARSIVKDIVATGYTRDVEGGQTEMEGMGPTIQSLFPQRARILDRAKANLRGNKRVFGAAVRGEESLTAAGNQLDREGNVRAKTENEQLLDILERQASSKGPISDALTGLASDLAGGKALPGLVSQFLTQVRGIVRRGENEAVRPGDTSGGVGEAGEGPEPPVEGQGGFFSLAPRAGGMAPMRTALNNSRVGVIRRGPEAMINRLRMQANLDRSRQHADRPPSTIHPDAIREVDQFIQFIGEHMFTDVGLRILQHGHGAAGLYDPLSHVVSLFRAAIDNGSVPHTMVHELWHSLERMLPREDRLALAREFHRQRERWFRNNPGMREFMDGQGQLRRELTDLNAVDWITRHGQNPEAMRSVTVTGAGTANPRVRMRVTRENYRYTNLSEYFAETMTDRHFNEMDIQDAVVRSIWSHFRDIFRRFVQAIQRLFGRDASGRIYEGYGARQYAPGVENGMLANTPGSFRSMRPVPSRRAMARARREMDQPEAESSGSLWTVHTRPEPRPGEPEPPWYKVGDFKDRLEAHDVARGHEFHHDVVSKVTEVPWEDQSVEQKQGDLSAGRGPREPTIRNDPNQVEMPGMRPSAAQAQIARDQTGTGRLTKPNQKAADEGLFAPRVEQAGLFEPRAATPAPPAPPPPVSKWAHDEVPNFTDELHLVQNPDGGHEAAMEFVLSRGAQTGFEHLAVVENATGRIIHAGTANERLTVSFKRAHTYGAVDAYTIHHNHPNETSISAGDLQMLTSPGITNVVAHIPAGHTFTVSLPDPSQRTENPYMANGFGNALARSHEGYRQEMIPIFQKLMVLGDMTHAEVQIAYGDALNRLLAQDGIINYSSTYILPDVALDAMRRASRGLHDRYTLAVPTAKRVAGLPTPTGSNAPAAPTGGGPGAGGSPVVAPRAVQGRLFSTQEVDNAFGLEAGKPIKDLVKWVQDQPKYEDARHYYLEFVAPLRLGPKEAGEEAFKFANNIRQGQRKFGQLAQMIRDTQKIDERWAIGRAVAEQSVFERKLARELATTSPLPQPGYEAQMRARWDATQMGVEGLGPKGKALVNGLKAIQEDYWNQLKSRGMVDPNAEGWAYWMPRQLVIMEPGKKARRIIKDDAILPGGTPRARWGRTPTPDMHPFGTNLTTEIPRFRNYEEIQDTLDAARAKYGPNVQLVDDIVGLVGALERIHAAIAGHDLLQAIMSLTKNGIAAGYTQTSGAPPKRGFYMAGHPSMYKMVPTFDRYGKVVEDSKGNPVFEKQAIFIDEAFRAPLDAVFRAAPGALMRGFMAVKAVSTHFVMQSPLIHLQVELGRAGPLFTGGKFVALTALAVGRRARMAEDPRIDTLVAHGMAPVMRGFIGDPVSLMNEFTYKSRFGLVGEAVVDIRNALANFAGKAPRGGQAMAALIRHPMNTLLWNRVMDLQIAIGLAVAEDRLAAGWHPTAAYTAAAHLANRYAGALPPEGMSRLANTLAQFLLFSRSFTGGNLGIIKDVVTGAPMHIVNHVEAEAGPEAAKKFRKWMRGKAQWTGALDMLAFYMLGMLIQHASQAVYNYMNDKESEESVPEGYVRRFHETVNYVMENPLKSLFIPSTINRLLPMADNEPGKTNRARVMPYGSTPQYLYMRTPLGKVGEELIDWISDFAGTLERKQSTMYKAANQFMSGKDDYGHDYRRPTDDAFDLKNVWRTAKHMSHVMFPIEMERDIYIAMNAPGSHWVGNAPPTARERGLAVARVLLNFSGIGSLSRGYPYGPSAGSNKKREDMIKFDTAEIMPEVQRLVNDGKDEEATKMLTDAGEEAGRASKIVDWLRPDAGNAAAEKAAQLGERRAARREDQKQLDRSEVIRRSYGVKEKPARELETTE